MGEAVIRATTPVPLSPTVCGLPTAFSFSERVAVRRPDACGEKATVRRQLLFAWSTPPEQPLRLILKSVVFAPLMLARMPVSDAVPTLVKVSVVAVVLGIAWLPKLTVVGDRLTNGVVPVPEMGTDCIAGGSP